MKIKVIVHEAIEGGYWAEVPAIPGCATEGDTWDELLLNLPHYDSYSLPPKSHQKSDRLEKYPC